MVVVIKQIKIHIWIQPSKPYFILQILFWHKEHSKPLGKFCSKNSLSPPGTFFYDPPILKFGTESCPPSRTGGDWYCVDRSLSYKTPIDHQLNALVPSRFLVFSPVNVHGWQRVNNPLYYSMNNLLLQKFTLQRSTMSLLLKNYSLVEIIYLLIRWW